MRENNATIPEIAKALGVTKMAIDKRIRKMKKCNIEVPESAYRVRRNELKEKIGEKKLAKAILKLQESENIDNHNDKVPKYDPVNILRPYLLPGKYRP